MRSTVKIVETYDIRPKKTSWGGRSDPDTWILLDWNAIVVKYQTHTVYSRLGRWENVMHFFSASNTCTNKTFVNLQVSPNSTMAFLTVLLMLGAFIIVNPTYATITTHQIEHSHSTQGPGSANVPCSDPPNDLSPRCQRCYAGERASNCTDFLNECESRWQQEEIPLVTDCSLFRTTQQPLSDLPAEENRSTFCSGLDDLYLVRQRCEATNGGLVLSAGVLVKLRQSLVKDLPDVVVEEDREFTIAGGAGGPFRTPTAVKVVIQSGRQVRIRNIRKAARDMLRSSQQRLGAFRRIMVSRNGNRWIVNFLFNENVLAELW